MDGGNTKTRSAHSSITRHADAWQGDFKGAGSWKYGQLSSRFSRQREPSVLHPHSCVYFLGKVTARRSEVSSGRANWVSPERGHAREFFGRRIHRRPARRRAPGEAAPAVSTPWGGCGHQRECRICVGFRHSPLLRAGLLPGELPGSFWVRLRSAASRCFSALFQAGSASRERGRMRRGWEPEGRGGLLDVVREDDWALVANKESRGQTVGGTVPGPSARSARPRNGSPCPTPCSPHPPSVYQLRVVVRGVIRCLAAAAGPRRHDDRRSARGVADRPFGWTGTHLHRSSSTDASTAPATSVVPASMLTRGWFGLGDLGLRRTERFTYHTTSRRAGALTCGSSRFRTDLAAQKGQHCPVCTGGVVPAHRRTAGGVQAFSLENTQPHHILTAGHPCGRDPGHAPGRRGRPTVREHRDELARPAPAARRRPFRRRTLNRALAAHAATETRAA